MQKIEIKIGLSQKKRCTTVFVSDDHVREVQEDIKEDTCYKYTLEERVGDYIETRIDEQFRLKSFYRYIDLFSDRTGLKGIAILLAHGIDENRNWMYSDDEKYGMVQDWLDQNDGRYACLVVLSCNTGSLTVKTKKSLLVIPDRIVTGLEEYILSLIHPRKGEVYTRNGKFIYIK